MYQKILVPIDGSPTSDQGLAEATGLAREMGSKMRLIHVVDQLSIMTSMAGSMTFTSEALEAMKKAGEEVLQKARAAVTQESIVVDTRLLDNFNGTVSDLVAKDAREWGADLIVLGTHGRRGVRRVLLGSDAEQILRSSQVPVLLVRAQSPGE